MGLSLPNGEGRQILGPTHASVVEMDSSYLPCTRASVEPIGHVDATLLAQRPVGGDMMLWASLLVEPRGGPHAPQG
jgi:hypothetical protein